MKKPSNLEIKSIFDKVASAYNEISNPYAVFRRKSIIAEWAKGRCLEVGAGTGEISRMLSKDHQVVATDISPQMVREIQKHGIESKVCDAEKLPFKDNSFDSVIAAEVIFYLDHPGKFISETHRILTPEGRLLLSSANDTIAKAYVTFRTFLRMIGFKKGMYCDDKVNTFMTSRTIRELLGNHKFRVVEEKKILILPVKFLDPINKMLEKTPLKHCGIFILTWAEKTE